MTSPIPSTDLGARSGEFETVPARTARALERLLLPGPRVLLSLVVILRLALIGIVAGRAQALGGASRLNPVIAYGIVGLAVAGTAMLAARLRGRVTPSATHIFLQSLIDVLLVTALVGLIRTDVTPLAALYVVLVAGYALMLPVGRGLVSVLFAVTAYIAVTLSTGAMPPDTAFWTQVAVIGFVGAVLAMLGNRLGAASREQRALLERLAQAQLEADEILATIQSGVITVDGDGRLGYLNPRAARILGLGTDAWAVGDSVLEPLRARSRELHDAIERGIREGHRLARAEAQVRRADGTLFPVGLSTTTFLRPGSDRPAVTAIFTDISDLKRLQEFRLRAERLEAVAALSASLAHEIRNPLAAIRSAVEQLAGRATADEDEQVLGDLVMRESARLNRLLSEFLDFSRVRATRFEELELLALVEDAVRTLGEHPETRGVALRVAGEPITLQGDPDLLHRIVSNLVLNAAQVLGGRGTVTASVGRAAPGEAPTGLIPRPVRIQVRDDGPGIPDGIRDRLFEPFVSGRSGGTGLGLAIVQRAVAAHRGIILVDSSPTVGTTFSIFLPVSWDQGDAT
ncbi:MAG TPA: ATP-binding protein [Gemmatimonadales bacterium]|nr:ATP-binding protein [Gemmatimonadales bacterium]